MVRLPKHQSLGRILHIGKTFQSKSGGSLHVMLQLEPKNLETFLGKTKALRVYRVSGVPKGGAGAKEFHKYSSEIITVEEGTFRLFLEDIRGRRKIVYLQERATYGIIEPFVLHTYIASANNSSLHVLANTLYHPRVKSTHDSCPESEFRKLQESLRRRKYSNRSQEHMELSLRRGGGELKRSFLVDQIH